MGSQEWGVGFIMGGWEVFKVSLQSWHRGANPPILWRPPILPTSPSPLYCQPPPTSSPPLFFLLSCFFRLNEWSCHIWCAILLNDSMDLHMLSLATIVPEWPWCVLYATRCQVYWGLTHMWFFTATLIWYRTHKHTTHSGASRLTHPYKYMFTPPVMCSQLND